jgi:hypothetical protein
MKSMGFSSTNTPLSGNAVYLSPTMQTDRADYISGTAFADQAGTLYVEQSPNGSDWDLSTSYAILANTGKGFNEYLYAPYVRLRFVNGASAQSVFRLYSRFTSAGDS